MSSDPQEDFERAELEGAGEPWWLWLALAPLAAAVYVAVGISDRLDDLRRRASTWPLPPEPIGCLTNDDVDALPDD